jgi:hypothetical protein
MQTYTHIQSEAILKSQCYGRSDDTDTSNKYIWCIWIIGEDHNMLAIIYAENNQNDLKKFKNKVE